MSIASTVAELQFSRSVKTVTENTKIEEIINILQSSNIGSVVIVEQERVIGIFTERDLLTKLTGNMDGHRKDPVGKFMTRDPKSVEESTAVTKVLELMHEGHFRHVLVVNNKQELVGIISIKDMLTYLISSIKLLEDNMSDLVSAMV